MKLSLDRFTLFDAPSPLHSPRCQLELTSLIHRLVERKERPRKPLSLTR